MTVTEVKLADSVLTGGGSWGEPVFVLPDGSEGPEDERLAPGVYEGPHGH